MKSFLRSASLLLTVSLLCACAPAATKTAGNYNIVDNPLRPGDVYLVKGSDQNSQTFESKLKITTNPTTYDGNSQWYYVDADNGYLVVKTGAINRAVFQNGGNTVICVTYLGQNQLPYRGVAIQGSEEEIKSLLNRYSGNDTNYYGGSNCVISKG